VAPFEVIVNKFDLVSPWFILKLSVLVDIVASEKMVGSGEGVDVVTGDGVGSGEGVDVVTGEISELSFEDVVAGE